MTVPSDFPDKQITMAHGAGGEASRRLIEALLRPAFDNEILAPMGDAAILASIRGPIAVTTDSFVVRPLTFPGGSIGTLAVNGTVNDLAVSGAEPIALTVSLILEAGLEIETLRREVDAMASAAKYAGVPIVGGDTKVVEHGKADGMYITTSGIGTLHPGARLGPEHVAPGDQVILSGPMGNHGITILLARAELQIEAAIQSDSQPLTLLTRALLDELGPAVKWMRDATRGGVATVLNELARDAGVLVSLEEQQLPVVDTVRGACELLGLDPLHVANEGVFVAIVSASASDRAVEILRSFPGGAMSCRVGAIVAASLPRVVARSPYGGQRVVDMLLGDPLPRIC